MESRAYHIFAPHSAYVDANVLLGQEIAQCTWGELIEYWDISRCSCNGLFRTVIRIDPVDRSMDTPEAWSFDTRAWEFECFHFFLGIRIFVEERMS